MVASIFWTTASSSTLLVRPTISSVGMLSSADIFHR
jgi:hypothetical protein